MCNQSRGFHKSCLTCVLMKLCWDPLIHTQTHTYLSTYKTQIPVSDLYVNDLRVDILPFLSLSLPLSLSLSLFTYLLWLPWAVRGKSPSAFMFTQKCRYYCSLLQVYELFAYKLFFFPLFPIEKYGWDILKPLTINHNFLIGTVQATTYNQLTSRESCT